jgi:response regulator RpfG family c-di-GMP phosphodiesterase
MNNNILIVDDSEFERAIRCYQLKEICEESNLFLAGTIEKAWGILNKDRIDLAIIDIYLPGKNGADLINDMICHKQLKDIPILVITGTSKDSFIKASYENYVSAYLHKPIETKLLISTVNEILNKKEEQKAS